MNDRLTDVVIPSRFPFLGQDRFYWTLQTGVSSWLTT